MPQFSKRVYLLERVFSLISWLRVCRFCPVNHVVEFVEKIPMGIQSPIRENGGGFSEGQIQRLAIARALLSEAPVLLLDEATSALDVATERKILRNVLNRSGSRTCIITTHRPSVLSMCDRIYRISDGRIEVVEAEEVERMIMDF